MFQLHSLLRLAMNSFSFKEFRACFSTLFAFLLWRVRQFRLAASILDTWKCLEPCIYDIILTSFSWTSRTSGRSWKHPLILTRQWHLKPKHPKISGWNVLKSSQQRTFAYDVETFAQNIPGSKHQTLSSKSSQLSAENHWVFGPNFRIRR